jgi:hypothetical protein
MASTNRDPQGEFPDNFDQLLEFRPRPTGTDKTLHGFGVGWRRVRFDTLTAQIEPLKTPENKHQ